MAPWEEHNVYYTFSYRQHLAFMFEEAMPENTGVIHMNFQSLYIKTGDTITSYLTALGYVHVIW